MRSSLLVVVALSACVPPEEGPKRDPAPCDLGDLIAAPLPIQTELGLVAAVDLESVHADVALSLDGLVVEAVAELRTGEEPGRPALLLSPSLEELAIDGEPVGVERVWVGTPSRELLVLPELEPCSAHTLTARYTLPIDWMADPDGARRMEVLDGDGLFWSAGLEDNQPGRFVEMWVPSNLLFDRFDLTLDLDLSGLSAEHEILATGGVVETEQGWELSWTKTSSHAPFWVVSPAALTGRGEAVAELPGGPVTVETRGLLSDPGAHPSLAASVAASALERFGGQFGPYPHGDRFLAWVRDDVPSSMEYAGATQTQLGLLEHEVLHSWFGRGAEPVADRDGWVDEAMTSWVADRPGLRAVPLDPASAPTTLELGVDGWDGALLTEDNYLGGSSILADLADRHGVDPVVEALGAFAQAHVDRPYSSADFEEHLVCLFDDDAVIWAIDHVARGGLGPVDRPSEWCAYVGP